MATFFMRSMTFILMLFSIQVGAQNCHITQGWLAMETQNIKVMQGEETIMLNVRTADNNVERAAGYQWICQQDAAKTAVLFIFRKSTASSFHMRNVFVPLEIHFFDDTGNQVGATVMRPEPPGETMVRRYYAPQKPFRYALEIARPLIFNLLSTPQPLRLLLESIPIVPAQ